MVVNVGQCKRKSQLLHHLAMFCMLSATGADRVACPRTDPRHHMLQSRYNGMTAASGSLSKARRFYLCSGFHTGVQLTVLYKNKKQKAYIGVHVCIQMCSSVCFKKKS